MKKTLKPLAISWLIFFGIAAALAHLQALEIETHHLDHVLEFGRDAFGRSCFLLALEAAFRSFRILLPILAFSIFASLAFSFIGLIRNDALQFLWHLLMDLLNALPGFLLAFALSALFGNERTTLLVAAVFLLLPHLSRFFESQIRLQLKTDFVLNSISLGAKSGHVFLTHLLPDLLASTLSMLPFLITRLLVIEISLSYLGLQFSTHGETWGALLYQGKDYLLEAWWIEVIAATPLILTLLSFHLLSKREQN